MISKDKDSDDDVQIFVGVAGQKLQTRLRMDAVYFEAATAAFERSRTRGLLARKASATKRLSELKSRKKELWARCRDQSNPEWLQLLSDFDGVHHMLEQAHAPLINEYSSCHILCASSLEAHINIVATSCLDNAQAYCFIRHENIRDKWALLPELLGNAKWNKGDRGFQKFDELIETRNELCHFKADSDVLVLGEVRFLEKLRLTEKDCQESLKTVKEMILDLSTKTGNDVPKWTTESGSSPFEAFASIDLDQLGLKSK
ncbi:MAG: hypothetical protein IIA66_06480 [Planctomycetes bacterium]|nr:hypothetical protein [Planctomycetota bacterium]